MAVPGKEAAPPPAPLGDSMRGEGEGTGGVHVQNAESPRVNQCHLAFLRDLAVPRETCLCITGKREPLRLLPAHTLHPAQQLWGQGGRLRAPSHRCPACTSSALLSAVRLCMGGTWHLSEWIFLNRCASVYAIHSISLVLAVPVTGFFSLGFIVIFFFFFF